MTFNHLLSQIVGFEPTHWLFFRQLFYHVVIWGIRRKQVVGIEPTLNSFADCRLIHLAILAENLDFKKITESRGLEPLCVKRHSFQGCCHTNLVCLPKTGAFGFEPKISVLETVGFPINSMLLEDLHRSCKSKIENIRSEWRGSNPQLSVWKTDTQPIEFHSQNFVIR